MNCPKCLKKTTVTTTRTPAKPGKGNDVHKGNDLVGWYTPDFVVRSRACNHCGNKFRTIEMSFDDVSAMLEEANKGHGRQVWDKNACDK